MELKENMINILEKNKKLILAHDKTEKRDAYVKLLINYILEKSKENGIKNPLVIKVDFLFGGIKKEGNLLTIGICMRNKPKALGENITEDETIVGLVVDDAALILTDVGASNELLDVDNYIAARNKSFYRVYTVTGFLNSPFVCNYAVLRNINFDFVKVAGIERINNLVKQFYIVDGANSRPTEEAANVFKIITRYMDIDSYNYIDENSFKMPKIFVEESGKKLINRVLENITRIDIEDMKNGCDFNEKRTHVIVVNGKASVVNSNIKKLSSFIIQDNRVKKLLSKTTVTFYDLPNFQVEAINDKVGTNEEILLMSHQNIEMLYSMKSCIRSINHINPDGFFSDLNDFICMYEAAYDSSFYSDENKIFSYSKSNKIERTNYCEIGYLFTKDIGIDLSKLRIIYDNYLKLGEIEG